MEATHDTNCALKEPIPLDTNLCPTPPPHCVTFSKFGLMEQMWATNHLTVKITQVHTETLLNWNTHLLWMNSDRLTPKTGLIEQEDIHVTANMRKSRNSLTTDCAKFKRRLQARERQAYDKLSQQACWKILRCAANSHLWRANLQII